MNDTKGMAKVCQRCLQTPVMTLDEQLNDPDSDLVRDALTRSCDGCKAPAGVLCHNHIQIGEPLPGRLVHIGRTAKR